MTGRALFARHDIPMVGGLVTSFAMELLVYPAIYLLWKRRTDMSAEAQRAKLEA